MAIAGRQRPIYSTVPVNEEFRCDWYLWRVRDFIRKNPGCIANDLWTALHPAFGFMSDFNRIEKAIQLLIADGQVHQVGDYERVLTRAKIKGGYCYVPLLAGTYVAVKKKPKPKPKRAKPKRADVPILKLNTKRRVYLDEK
jgi:hypothetical protein